MIRVFMDVNIFINLCIIVSGVIWGLNPFDKKRVRAGWAKWAFGITAVLWIAVGAIRLAESLDSLQLGLEAFNRVNSYVCMAQGVVMGVLLMLILSGQFFVAKQGAEPGSSDGKPSFRRICMLAGISAIATVVIVYYGGKQAASSGVVSFPDTGVALAPGADWEPTEAPSVRRVALKGQGPFDGSVIKVYVPTDGTDVQSGVALLRSNAEGRPEVSQDSFKQEDFVSESGVRGIHFSYESSDPEHRVARKVRAHDYLFQNKNGRCVVIFYVTYADRDPDTVHQMILKTLTLE
jgi:hypothetical protein